jgi:hypothetical protein
MLNIARFDRLHDGSVVVVPLRRGIDSVDFSHGELDVQEETYAIAELLISDWRLVSVTLFLIKHKFNILNQMMVLDHTLISDFSLIFFSCLQRSLNI